MKVYLTRRAERNYSSIKTFLLQRWGQQVATAFEIKVRQFLELLPNFPSIGALEVPDKQIRSFPITSQTRVFYRIRDKKLIVFSFFDMRQDPKKKPLD